MVSPMIRRIEREKNRLRISDYLTIFFVGVVYVAFVIRAYQLVLNY